jgi:hypothetical protein
VHGEVVEVATLSPGDRRRMFTLLDRYFDGTTPERFARDLAGKQWAVILRDVRNGELLGFSTLARGESVVNGERVVAFYSGDTIVDRTAWNETALARVWSRHVFSAATTETGARVVWLLICSGYRTYRFLPVFFREFYPRHDAATPARERDLVRTLAAERFGDDFAAERGTVRFLEPARLREGIGDVGSARMRDPHVGFFLTANPGHADGDELVCLADLTPDNLTPAGRRMAFGR